ncbi:unnamed protein product [Dicrocoelium dendriticum]|nr:unnamed protein product [Dicrocoelium dendriticum]
MTCFIVTGGIDAKKMIEPSDRRIPTQRISTPLCHYLLPHIVNPTNRLSPPSQADMRAIFATTSGLELSWEGGGGGGDYAGLISRIKLLIMFL